MLFNYLYSENKLEIKNKFKEILKITKTKNINEFINYIKYLKRSSGLEDDYKKLNINIRKDLNQILKGVNPLRLKNNPVDLDIENLKNIILRKNI